MTTSEKVAGALLKIKAVFLRPEEPFTWASGIKSPIYCDNRLILSDPEARKVVEEAIAETVTKEYPEAHSSATSTGTEKPSCHPPANTPSNAAPRQARRPS